MIHHNFNESKVVGGNGVFDTNKNTAFSISVIDPIGDQNYSLSHLMGESLESKEI